VGGGGAGAAGDGEEEEGGGFDAGTAVKFGKFGAILVGPGRYCSPRYPTHSTFPLEPSLLELSGNL